MSEMTEREKELWDELQEANKKVGELTAAWVVEYRKRLANDRQEEIERMVEERIAAERAAVARG